MFTSIVLAALAQSSTAGSAGLERFRARLDRMAESDSPMSSLDIDALERELAATLGVPKPWRLDLDPRADEGSTSGETIVGHLVLALPDAPEVRLSLSTSVQADCVNVDRVGFVAADGRSAEAKFRFATRTDFFGPSAMPIVLSSVANELAGLPLERLRSIDLSLQGAHTLGERPSVECYATARGNRTCELFSLFVHGSIELPKAAAHPPEFRFESTRTSGESELGPRPSKKSLRAVFLESIAAWDFFVDVGAWRVDVQSWSDGNGATIVLACGGGPLDEDRWVPDLRFSRTAARSERGDLRADWSFGPVRFADDVMRSVLVELTQARERGDDEILFVGACAELSRIDAVVRPKHSGVGAPGSARALRWSLDDRGNLLKFDSVDAGPASRRVEDQHDVWSISCAENSLAVVRVRHSVFCRTDEDLATYATLDGRTMHVFGGAIETVYRGRSSAFDVRD